MHAKEESTTEKPFSCELEMNIGEEKVDPQITHNFNNLIINTMLGVCDGAHMPMQPQTPLLHAPWCPYSTLRSQITPTKNMYEIFFLCV